MENDKPYKLVSGNFEQLESGKLVTKKKTKRFVHILSTSTMWGNGDAMSKNNIKMGCENSEWKNDIFWNPYMHTHKFI